MLREGGVTAGAFVPVYHPPYLSALHCAYLPIATGGRVLREGGVAAGAQGARVDLPSQPLHAAGAPVCTFGHKWRFNICI